MAATETGISPREVSGDMGVCPNCDASLPLDAQACPKCMAEFGPNSSWKVLSQAEAKIIRNRPMSPGDVLFSFDGRLARRTFLIYYAVIVVIYIAASLIGKASGHPLLSVLVSIILFISTAGLYVKRCHDRGRSGWFYLLGCIPIINLWVFIELIFLRGQRGENKYGPDPLAQPD
jgi:uncharacterized membrane protein YhaH (DUF805 family)